MTIQDTPLTTREVLTYIASNDEPGPPAPGYLVKILTGAREFDLPQAYQRILASFQG